MSATGRRSLVFVAAMLLRTSALAVGIFWGTIRGARALYAIELNPHARASMARSYPGIRRFQYPENVPDGSVDVLFTTSAIEHFECPLTELREAVRKLRRGGRLIVGVKNEGMTFAGPMYRNNIDHHLWTWNRQLLLNLLTQAGVHVTNVQPPIQYLLKEGAKAPVQSHRDKLSRADIPLGARRKAVAGLVVC